MTDRAIGHIARTKVRRPVMPPLLVARPNVTNAFEFPDNPALTVVAGPAGAGKTTAVLQWLAERQGDGKVSWVSLDPDDDTPRTFWWLVAAAIREVEPGLLNETSAFLDEPGADLATTTVPTLINELLDLDHRLVIVIDDFHHIASAAILEQFAFLITRRPPLVRLVVTSRHSLDLPLATWRAHRELIEINADHLTFDRAETDRLVQSIRPDTDDATIARLHNETEGWVAGLHLAISALDDTDHRPRIGTYLLEDALAQEPEGVVAFLLDVSILDDLVPSACNAVTGRNDCRDLLVDLERRNLFLTAIDTPGGAWRTHSLLRGTLETELHLRRTPQAITELHHRAATWALDNGDWKMGVHHLTRAEDHDGAAAALAMHWLTALNHGEFERFDQHASALAPDIVDAHPDLWIGLAFASLNLGRLEQARQRADRCERVAGHRQLGGIALVRCHYHRHTGNLPEAATAARAALSILERGDDAGRAGAAAALGESLYWLDDQDAVAHLTVAVDVGQASGELMSAIAGHAHLAAWRALDGDTIGARTHVDEALAIARPQGLDQRHHCAMVAFTEGVLAADVGDFSAAEFALERAITLARHGREPLAQVAAWLSLADIRQRVGDVHGAKAAFTEAERVHRSCVAPGRLTDQLESTRQNVSGHAAASKRNALVEPLTDRELTMLRLLRSELTQREIATHLFISFNTARTHTKAIYRKLGVASRAEALAAGAAHGLI